MGKANESQQHQQALHRNLVYLASYADTTQNMSQLLPVSKCINLCLKYVIELYLFSLLMYCSKAAPWVLKCKALRR